MKYNQLGIIEHSHLRYISSYKSKTYRIIRCKNNLHLKNPICITDYIHFTEPIYKICLKSVSIRKSVCEWMCMIVNSNLEEKTKKKWKRREGLKILYIMYERTKCTLVELVILHILGWCDSTKWWVVVTENNLHISFPLLNSWTYYAWTDKRW